MINITVKNIPPDLYERLKQNARLNNRSINREIIACIERTVSSRPVDVEMLLATARRLREKTALYQTTDTKFSKAKTEGRP